MLTRWNDFGFGGWGHELSMFNDLRQQMDRLFADFERGWGFGGSLHHDLSSVTRSSWPRMHLYDTGAELRLRAEVPGLSEKDLEISVEPSSLTIKGEHQNDAPEGYAVHRRERAARAFARSFSLPCRIETKKVTAHLENGVLQMTLPKVAEERPRQISVKAS